ncbi:RIP metalloprotease RseP [Pelomicrobium methylotrophicum]|uniref:Zinc metalloprotease n=1 Tax=Pelomicrobium methylotrophicum TaxID=2602750 RepID=A0A5C7F2E0_9PROT|nr:RIP metalloprotease RseP [Pelomicrobium methylotrophicum]TXF13667.1 RIP metalloprotease RseP [Pelomicrobium methylotrophicum]
MTDLLLTVVAFALALGVLIVFHELGHYTVARWCGVKVVRFSVGFGKPLVIWRAGRDGTEWAISAFPLGGYVKMLDEREGDVPPDEKHRAFNRQSVYRRFAIVLAGPLANFLLAIVLYWLLFVSGVPGLKPVLGPVAPGSPAAVAGLGEGDTLLAVDGKAVTTWQDARWHLLDKALGRDTVVLEVETADGRRVSRSLALSGLTRDDLDGDLLARLGLSPFRPSGTVSVGRVLSHGAGARAGLREGDIIVAIDGEPIRRADQVVEKARSNPGRALEFEVQRSDTRLRMRVVPEPAGEGEAKTGRIGIEVRTQSEAAQSLVVVQRYGLLEAAVRAAAKTWDTTMLTLHMLGRMIIGEVSWRNVSGPLTIADYAGQSAQMGWMSYVNFIALVSVSLGILNLLPIPVLDGGHLMYYIVEIFKGRPVSEKAMELGQQVGMALLFVLMAFALYNDINRLFTG